MGRFKDEPTVVEVFERIIAEAKEAQQKLRQSYPVILK
jgi:chorismate mutase